MTMSPSSRRPRSAGLLILMLSVRQAASHAGQTTTYEAGSSAWDLKGNVTTLSRAQFNTSCASGSPGFGDDGLPVYILSSARDSVSLDFDGNSIAVYGITFAYNPCEVGHNPTRSFLDVAGPVGIPPAAGCPSPAFHTPIASCMLLAQYTDLNSTDRHRISVSTTARKLAVINAQVAGDASINGTLETQTSRGSAVSDDLQVASISSTRAISSTGSATSADPIKAPHPGSISSESLTTSFFSVSETVPQPSELSGAGVSASTGPSRATVTVPPARVIAPAVLCTVVALCVAASLLFVYRRRRLRDAAHTHVTPFDAVPSRAASLSSMTSTPSRDDQKIHVVEAAPHAPRADGRTDSLQVDGQTDSLQAAVEGTGLSARDLLASLDRLREQARYSCAVAVAGSDVAPPQYDA